MNTTFKVLTLAAALSTTSCAALTLAPFLALDAYSNHSPPSNQTPDAVRMRQQQDELRRTHEQRTYEQQTVERQKKIDEQKIIDAKRKKEYPPVDCGPLKTATIDELAAVGLFAAGLAVACLDKNISPPNELLAINWSAVHLAKRLGASQELINEGIKGGIKMQQDNPEACATLEKESLCWRVYLHTAAYGYSY